MPFCIIFDHSNFSIISAEVGFNTKSYSQIDERCPDKGCVAVMWLVEKKIFYHILDLGYEGVGIPIRVKFEFDVREGKYVHKSLSFEHLCITEPLLKRYPNLKSEQLEQEIYETVKCRIREYLFKNRYISEDTTLENDL